VYAGDWLLRLSRVARQAKPSAGWRVPANVWGLGITSLLTDVSSEMVVSILPAYLVLTSGFAPLLLGVATGLHEGGPLLVTWIGGWIADRSGRRKLTAGLGYALSALCRFGWLLLSGRTVGALALLILGDRMGKAIRTAPRDAIISLSAPPNQLATAFGVHRALDAAGAAIGPVLAFVLLWQFPHRFDLIFFTSFIVALLGVAALVLLVDEVESAEGAGEPRGAGEAGQAGQAGGAAVAAPSRARPGALAAMALFADASLRRVLLLAGAFGLVTISDAFIYVLLIQRSHADAYWIPLLYTGTAIAFLVLAIPIGSIADRVGRRRVFIFAHGPLLLAYAMAWGRFPAWPWNAVTCTLLLGAFYAASDGVLASLASGFLPAASRAMGLAWVETASSLARLCSSILFGILWTRAGDLRALETFTLALIAVVALFTLFVRGGDAGPDVSAGPREMSS
jgi:MFS family permease